MCLFMTIPRNLKLISFDCSYKRYVHKYVDSDVIMHEIIIVKQVKLAVQTW